MIKVSQYSSSDKKYCPYCGSEHNDGDAYCANCGQSLEKQDQSTQYQPAQYQPTQYQPPATSGPVYSGTTQTTQPYYGKPQVQDKVSVGLIILSVLIPIAGFIAAIVRLTQSRKKEALAYFIAGIAGVGINLLFQFFLVLPNFW